MCCSQMGTQKPMETDGGGTGCSLELRVLMALVESDTLWEVGMDNASLGGSVLALTLLLQCAGWQWALGKASCALHRV